MMAFGGAANDAETRQGDVARAASSGYPIPNSSTFSSGVPHFRQITAAQSPHTSGSATTSPQVGQ
jgi:hypothetical protein